MKGFRVPSGAEYCIALSSDPGFLPSFLPLDSHHFVSQWSHITQGQRLEPTQMAATLCLRSIFSVPSTIRRSRVRCQLPVYFRNC